MSKVNQLRALREAKWAASQTSPKPTVKPATNPFDPYQKPEPLPEPAPPRTISAVPEPSSEPQAAPPAAVSKGPAEPLKPAPTQTPESSPKPVLKARGARPNVEPGQLISKYSDQDLERMVAWVCSDGKPRNLDQIIEDVMLELGFTRKGKTIKARLVAAYEKAS